MIRFNNDICLSCGKCASDCSPHIITIGNTGPIITNEDFCLRCGHCIAVCPVSAVYDDELDMTESTELTFPCSPSTLLGMMRSRRSCRHYKHESVSKEDILKVINAARACPTAKNQQDLRFIVVTEGIPKLIEYSLETLSTIGKKLLASATDKNEIRRAENFISWYDSHKSNASFDPLFFGAPLLLLFVSKKSNASDAAASAAYAELMAYACGLGSLYCGYFTACASISSEIQNYLSIASDEQIVRCLVLGKPDIKYHRTVARNPAKIEYR